MEAVNLAAFGLEMCLAFMLAAKVLRSGPVSLWNGFLYADALSALTVLLSAFVALVCSIYAVGYLRQDERDGVFQDDEELVGRFVVHKVREYYTLTPLFVFSMILVALANNLGILWVAIEGTTLASVFLVMFYGRKTSLEAAWKYAIIGGVGLSMALFGTILTYYSAHLAPGNGHARGLELVRPRGKRRPVRQGNHAVGLHSDPAGLWNQGGHRSHAHMEARCLQ